MTGCDWLRPGIHADVPAEDYHSPGITKQPALSSSIAHLLITHSPLHAWNAHPQLNPAHVRREEQKFDVGTAAHSILLQGEDIVAVIDAADWRTSRAKDARDDARHTGLVPLLTSQWEQVHAMVTAVKAQLREFDCDPPLFTDGQPEQTIVWQDPETGVCCKARLDWLHRSGKAIDDFKTTNGSANPHVWSRRTFWTIGCDVQIAFHSRGVHALTGIWPTWRYAIAECSPPYAVSILSPHNSTLELGHRKVDYAIRKWAQCLETDRWEGYPREIGYVELDTWAESDFLQRTYSEPEVTA